MAKKKPPRATKLDKVQAYADTYANIAGHHPSAALVDAFGRAGDQSLITASSHSERDAALSIGAAVAASSRKTHVATHPMRLNSPSIQTLREFVKAAGFTVSTITPAATTEERRAAYLADVVIGTLDDFAADHLFDCCALDIADQRQSTWPASASLIVDNLDEQLVDRSSERVGEGGGTPPMTLRAFAKMHATISGVAPSGRVNSSYLGSCYGIETIDVSETSTVHRTDAPIVPYVSENSTVTGAVKDIRRAIGVGRPVLVESTDATLLERVMRELEKARVVVVRATETDAPTQPKPGVVTVGSGLELMSAAGDMLSFDADTVRERDIVRSLGGVHLVGLGLRDTQRADERFVNVIDAAAHGSTVQHVFVNGGKSVKALSDALTARVAYEKEQEITRMRDLTYQSISDSQREIITWDRQRLLLSGSLLNLVETGAQEAADWVASEADPNHPEGVLQVVNSFIQTDLVASDVSGALSDGALGGLVGEKFATWAREAWAAAPIGDADRVARGVALAVVDRKWAEHYRFLVELRQGISYRRYAKLTPNIEFAKEADEAFNWLRVSIAVETFGFAAHRLAGAGVCNGS